MIYDYKAMERDYNNYNHHRSCYRKHDGKVFYNTISQDETHWIYRRFDMNDELVQESIYPLNKFNTMNEFEIYITRYSKQPEIYIPEIPEVMIDFITEKEMRL